MVATTETGWLSPDDVIADDLFPTDAPVELQLKTGECVTAFYGYVEDEEGSPWRAFYDHDGVEIFHLDMHRIEVAKWPEIRDGVEKLLAAVSKP